MPKAHCTPGRNFYIKLNIELALLRAFRTHQHKITSCRIVNMRSDTFLVGIFDFDIIMHHGHLGLTQSLEVYKSLILTELNGTKWIQVKIPTNKRGTTTYSNLRINIAIWKL